jgi:hypothetical protein
MAGTNQASPPRIKDLRVIALASWTNTFL